MSWFSDRRAEQQQPQAGFAPVPGGNTIANQPTMGGVLQPSLVAAPGAGFETAGSTDYSHLARTPEEAQFISRIVDAQTQGYGGVRPGQVEYYLDLLRQAQATGETAPWLNDKPGLTMADYYEQRAMGMGAGGNDTATQGQYAGQNFGSLGYQQAGGSPFGGPGDGAAAGSLPPGYSIGDFYGGGKYPLSSFMAPGILKPFTAAFERPTVTDDPGYQFRMDEGQKAIERGAAAKGTLLSGGTIKDMLNYGQGLASQEYQNAYNRDWNEYLTSYNIYDRNQANTFNRLNSVTGLGQNSAAVTGDAANRYAGRSGDLMTQIGNVNAAGAVNTGNTIGDLVNPIAEMIRRKSGGGSTAPPPPTGTASPYA